MKFKLRNKLIMILRYNIEIDNKIDYELIINLVIILTIKLKLMNKLKQED